MAHPRGEAVRRILATAINAVAPGEAVRRFVRREADRLYIGTPGSTPRVYELDQTGRVLVFGLGKAAAAMTASLVELLADQNLRGLLVVKHPLAAIPQGFVQVVGGHPVPNAGSLLAGEKLKEFLENITASDLLICLISGGGSALISSPCPGVALEDLQALTALLLGCGARIDEINTLRRHLDSIKGGGLARLAAPARVISLILSDVVGSPLEAIASGPTVPDPSSRQAALAILEKYDLTARTPPAVLSALQTANETPKPGSKLFEPVQNVIVGDNLLAAQAALGQARQEGFNPFYLRGDLQGEARVAALELCQNLRSALRTGQPVARPFCILAGGETTVTLRGGGRGGRNQELALAAAVELADLPDCLLVSLATDGEDGPTDAAGAVVGPETLRMAAQAGLQTQTYLENNDAYTYFKRLGDLLKPGPTGTNVNDLIFLFGF
jgi:hydroxypyruvate reductase